MQNDTPEHDNDNIFSGDENGTGGPAPVQDDDDDIWGAASLPPVVQEDAPQEPEVSAPPPPQDDDRTRVLESLPNPVAPAAAPLPPVIDVPSVPMPDISDPVDAVEEPAPVSMPPTIDIPEVSTADLSVPPMPEITDVGLSLPPVTEDANLSAPPASAADSTGLEVPPADSDVPEVVAVTAPPEPVVDVAEQPVDAPASDIIAEPAVEDAVAPEEAGLESPPADAREADTSAVASPPEPQAPEVVAEVQAPPPDPTPVKDGGPVPVGTMINNNYEIKELLSAGGMGEVFRGENAFTGDAVAIKIVLQSLANDEKIAALFMREAKVLCGLSDQAIVRYYNFVKDAELDRFCLIMEFISGQSLSDHVREVAPLTEDEARGLMRRVASGLEKAHQMEVVHRDLSPDNVMLRDGKVSDAVLIDFGIAKSTEMAEQTLHGQLAGKFKYISPEQLGHFGGEIGPRTDIYGLGLLMAAGLRGEPLDMGSSVVEAVNARREIPDLSEIPASLRPLLAHMLEPDPAHRPARMSDVIRLIDQPEDVPEQYGGPRPIASEQTNPPGGRAPAYQQPGLIPTPGVTLSGQTMGGLSIAPGAGDASPFGAPSVAPGQVGTYVPGMTQPPMAGQQTMPGGAGKRRRSSEGGGAARWILILILIGGIGGFVANQQGLLPFGEQTADAGDTIEDEVTSTPAGPMTRAGFLSTYESGECSFAARISGGRDAGTIEAFSNTDGVFSTLADDFEAAFDTRPTIRTRVVSETNCAALDLARALQGSKGSAPILTLDTDKMQSGGSIVGRLRDRRGRPVWLVLVTPAGGVYNLTDRLTEQADGSATFSFGLNADGSGDAQPQLLMAVASDQPLIAAAAANAGARASDLLPLIEAEIAGRDGAAGAAIGYFELLP